MNICIAIAAIVVGTWNGNWFPSGRAEHRAHPAVEAATVAAAAQMLSDGLKLADPAGTNDVIICLNEMRGPKVVSNLVARIGRKGLRLASISGYRRRDRFDTQQDAIATTLPIAEVGWRTWRNEGSVRAPRGYAFAAVIVSPAVTAAVYAVHLKSNYGARSPQAAADNRAKRMSAVRELVSLESPRYGRLGRPVIVAGDFNADKWRAEFAGEPIFPILEELGYLNLLAILPPEKRGTHPSARWGDSALDYIFVRDFDSVASPRIVPNDGLSDHQALFAVIAPRKD